MNVTAKRLILQIEECYKPLLGSCSRSACSRAEPTHAAPSRLFVLARSLACARAALRPAGSRTVPRLLARRAASRLLTCSTPRCAPAWLTPPPPPLELGLVFTSVECSNTSVGRMDMCEEDTSIFSSIQCNFFYFFKI
jgi:hypothetical protein